MIPYPSFALRGQSCQCGSCGLLFRRTSTFDAHRYGPAADRRCYASMQLAERGWTQDSRGFWRRPGRKIGEPWVDPDAIWEAKRDDERIHGVKP